MLPQSPRSYLSVRSYLDLDTADSLPVGFTEHRIKSIKPAEERSFRHQHSEIANRLPLVEGRCFEFLEFPRIRRIAVNYVYYGENLTIRRVVFPNCPPIAVTSLSIPSDFRSALSQNVRMIVSDLGRCFRVAPDLHVVAQIPNVVRNGWTNNLNATMAFVLTPDCFFVLRRIVISGLMSRVIMLGGCGLIVPAKRCIFTSQSCSNSVSQRVHEVPGI